MSTTDDKTAGLRPARRTVVKGAAWAVPAVMVAGPARAQGASVPCVGSACVDLTGRACKHPGNPKWYHFEVCITNSSLTDPVTVDFDYMVVNSVTGTMISPASTVVPADTTVCITVDSGLFGDSANGFAQLYFSVGGVQDVAESGFNDINPCGTGPANTWLSQQPSGDPPH